MLQHNKIYTDLIVLRFIIAVVCYSVITYTDLIVSRFTIAVICEKVITYTDLIVSRFTIAGENVTKYNNLIRGGRMV